MRRLLVVMVVAVGALAWSGGPALAHATLTGSNPADGASLGKPPSKVTLRYDENLRDPSVVIVSGPGGKRVDHGGTTVLDNTVSVAVSPRTAGRYTVSYRVVSADGHPVSGTLSFRVADGAAATSAAGDTGDPADDPGPGARPWLLGAVGLAVLAAAVVLMTRRPRRSDDEDRA